MADSNRIPFLRRTALACGAALAVGLCASLAAASFAQGTPMKIRLQVGGETATATLNDSAASRDFAALLPLTLTLENYAGVERIAPLPAKLSAAGSPDGIAPRRGDIAFYAPWGNLAVFVGDDVYARGLLRLGRVDTGLATLQRQGPFPVRIERLPD